ncbi:MAG: dimethylamine corrinoid protein [Candidatus Methanomethylophilaceae archaeon]|nr:dimethylamine corrinoid protein [Candidatus Methanomethylophilaceae archaeon]
MDEEALLKELADAVIACNPVRAKEAAEAALEAKMDPVKAINEGLVVGMGVIGDNYAARKMYLPQVLVAAHSMYEGLDVLIPAIPKENATHSRTALTAVVQGDVHDIGKNIVKTMLTAGGYAVTDLGNDVEPDIICDTAKNDQINVVCLSTLMTPTLDNMQLSVKKIIDSGYRQKCIITIGGPPTSDAFAKEIGADHRDTDAQACVKYVNSRIKEVN